MQNFFCSPLILIGLFFIYSCTHSFSPRVREPGRHHNGASTVSASPVRQARTTLLESYIPAETKKFILPLVPTWANFSTSAKCLRKTQAYAIDVPNAMKAFNLAYSDTIQLQYLYNLELNINSSDQPVENKFQSLKEEEQVFYRTIDKIIGKNYPFTPPQFGKIHVIWIDSFLDDKEKLIKLSNYVKQDLAMTGAPVFLSLCLSHREFQEFLEANDLTGLNPRFIPYELFSKFNEQGKPLFHFTLSLNELFEKTQKLFFHKPKAVPMPIEITGNFKTQDFKF